MSKRTPNNGRVNRAIKPAKPTPRFELESADEARLPILKTYKVYIGGKFPRTESGRYYLIRDARKQPLANVCRCSRKDVRDAVVAARAAQGAWASRSAYNRSQILYRIAEMLEGRKAQFIDELQQQGVSLSEATRELQLSVDRLVYYAGWADKYQQVFSSVNPVSSSHFNFSLLEPAGVVTAILPEAASLLGLVSVIAPIIVGGNSVVALASTSMPLCAVTFAEVLATSDLPGGVVNLLTGETAEMLETMANHMDVNAIVYARTDPKHLDRAEITRLRELASLNIKRPTVYDTLDWSDDSAQSPYRILDTQEVKTTWHPVGT